VWSTIYGCSPNMSILIDEISRFIAFNCYASSADKVEGAIDLVIAWQDRLIAKKLA
jgi:hypothetical protein